MLVSWTELYRRPMEALLWYVLNIHNGLCARNDRKKMLITWDHLSFYSRYSKFDVKLLSITLFYVYLFFTWLTSCSCRILSDCIPISGRRRLPYLVISTILSLFPWLILGLANSLRSSRDSLTAFLTLQNLGSAMADVVVDAMIAEAVRSELYVEFTWLCCF